MTNYIVLHKSFVVYSYIPAISYKNNITSHKDNKFVEEIAVTLKSFHSSPVFTYLWSKPSRTDILVNMYWCVLRWLRKHHYRRTLKLPFRLISPRILQREAPCFLLLFVWKGAEGRTVAKRRDTSVCHFVSS